MCLLLIKDKKSESLALSAAFIMDLHCAENLETLQAAFLTGTKSLNSL